MFKDRFKLLFCSLFFLWGLSFMSLDASPGALDHRGGHNCWNQCEKWGLHQGEYHIHEGSQQFHRDD